MQSTERAEVVPEGTRVLNLVTSPDAAFFRQQVATLEARGVETDCLSVPGTRDPDAGTSRSPADYLRLYPRAIRRSFGEYDLIHANYGLTAPAALAQPNLPVVVTLWGSDLLGRYGWLSRWCSRLADATIVMTEEMASQVSGDVHVIPHGVDLERFRPRPREAARAELGWREDAYHALFPYSPAREVKDYPRAKRVVEGARRRVERPVELQVVSGVDHERVPTYVNAADALLLTSRREGSPNSVKEAMACNVPVVATDVGDVAERLTGVTPSRVCETDAELVEALARTFERGQRSNGRTAVRETSLERMGERIVDVYADVRET